LFFVKPGLKVNGQY